MDKQDELAAVIEQALRDCVDGPRMGLSQSGRVAAAVRSFMGSPEVVERVGSGVRAYLADHTGFSTPEGDDIVAAYYGGNWIMLNTAQIARAALSAAIGEPEGALRSPDA